MLIFRILDDNRTSMLEDEDYRDKEQQAAVKCVGTNQKFQTGEKE